MSNLIATDQLLLSGQLVTATGGQLYINGSAAAGGSIINVTGSSSIVSANFTGIGGAIIFTSGGLIFISGGAGGGGSYDPLGTAANSGQILNSSILALSGFTAPAAAKYVLTSGIQTITSQKIFADVLSFNSGTTSAVHLVGAPNNYTFQTGDYIVIATGASNNWTGILPNPALFSGMFFIFINGMTGPVTISGNIGSDVNPIISPTDALEVYAANTPIASWNYIRQTGNAAISHLYTDIQGLSGLAMTNLGSTGNALYILATGLSGADNAHITLTGQTLLSVVSFLSGFVTGASGYLSSHTASGSSLTVTGSNTIANPSLIGVSGMSVITSGSQVIFNASATQTLQPSPGVNLTLMAGTGILTNVVVVPAVSGSLLIFNTGGVMDIGLIHSDLTMALGSNDVKTPFYGYFHHTGAPPTNGVGHGIGGLFRSQDISGASMPLIGVEGRVDAFGYASAYTSAAFNSTYIGNTFTGVLYGANISSLNIYSGDGATPLPQGVSIGFYVPPMVGGSAQFSFYASNILRVNNTIQAYDTAGVNSIIIYDDGTNGNIQTSAGEIILTPANGIVLMNAALAAPLTNGALLGQAGNAWNVTATNLNLNGQQISATGNNLFMNGVNVTPRPIGFSTDGAGSVVVTGIKGYVTCPYAGTITGWTLVANQSGNLNIDIYKIASGVTLPNTSIVAGGLGPSLSGAAIAYSASLSTWGNTQVAVNDIFGWVVTGAPSTITKFTFSLNIA